MFVEFLYELRARKVPVGAQEAVALARALASGLHESSLEGFYHVARALCVHSEIHLDDFDLAFSKHFKGIEVEAKKIAEEILEWLKDPMPRRALSDEERAALEALDIEEVLRRFEERLKEQKERHDGGNRWIGTAGTSPFGRGGENPGGIQVGPGGGGKGGAMKTADARKYKPYRNDLVLDIRQVEVALRKLRAFAREGTDQELDIEGTIDATAKNAGELEVVTRPPRRPNTRVILMMDVGGSMDPYSHLMSQLFSAAKRSTHWKELRTYYFHNCVYGKVYKTEGFQDPINVRDVLHECGKHYKLVFVGDASMAPYELLGSSSYGGEDGSVAGVSWLAMLREHFERSVWLNPDLPATPEELDSAGGRFGYQSTVDVIRGIFPMFSLTIAGLDDAIKELMGRRTARPMVLPRFASIG
jgi:uncharacterized protein with von Willebrand factor type A (vWA) domain